MHDTTKPSRPSAGLVILLGALTAFGAISIDLYLPALPAIAHHFGAPVAAAQITMSSFLAGMAVGQLVFGPLSDRVGRRMPLIGGAILYAIASLALALSPSIELMAAGRFVQAIGACAGAVIARAVVRDRFDMQESARIFSLMFLVLAVAPMLAPSLGAVLLDLFGWQSIFLVLTAFGVVSAVAVWLGLPESRSAETARHAASESTFRSYLEALKDRRVAGAVMAGALNGAALFTYIGASPALFMEHFGQDPHVFGWTFAVNAAGMVIASQLNRYLLLRFKLVTVTRTAVLATLVISLVFLLLALSGLSNLYVTIALVFLSLGSYGLVGSNTTALALGVMPIRAGAISGMIGAAAFALGALASALTAPFAANGPTAMAAGMFAGFAGSTFALIRIARIFRWNS